MFKRLRERIAEEATKFPVGQLSNNSGKLFTEPENKSAAANSTEDLITLSDSSSVVVPHTSSQQFSIGEDEDGSLSEQSTPQRKQNDLSGGQETNSNINSSKEHHFGTLSDFGQEYQPSKSLPYVPQSDIESEREEPPTLNLDGISKDQLMTVIQTLKAKSYKYKNKYAEVVKNFKELRDEKIKIESTLIENQDKALRRIAELREQCQLEQKAKAHLEANLRLLLEEKDSRISVLETQNNLLKESEKSASIKAFQEDGDIHNSELGNSDTKSEDSISSTTSDTSILQEKVERLQHQHNQDKKTITAQKDQISLLRKQSENLSQELEEKVKMVNNLEDELTKLKSDHESVLMNMQSRLNELEKQQEESIMSMAETKRNMHEELELKEKQLIKAEEEARQFQSLAEHEKDAVAELKKQCEEKVNELQRQLESTEKALEEEKQNLMQELTRGKTAAINLMQQECAKKISSIEEEWKAKLQELQQEKEKNFQSQVEDISKKITETEEKLKKSGLKVDELNSLVGQLEKENASLKNTIEKLESESWEAHHEESLKCMKDKLQNAEKNYKTQMEEMKLKLSNLEKDKSTLENKLQELEIIQNKFKELKNVENEVQSKLKSKDDEIRTLQQKFETLNKEHVEKIHNFQEAMKDKENMVLKLKSNLECVSKENYERIEELSKRIKLLEEEREQLMLQAQDRVSTTEAKCREDIKLLQEQNNKLLLENSEIEKLKTKLGLLNNQLDESLIVAESNQAAASQEVSFLKEQLAGAEEKLTDIQKAKDISEKELSNKLDKLQRENALLLSNSDHVERLKAEKEELNEKLKRAEQQINEVKQLEAEIDYLKKGNEVLSKELSLLKSVQSEKDILQTRIEVIENRDTALKQDIENLRLEREKLMSDISVLKASVNKEVDSLKAENNKLLNRISILEKFDSVDPENTALKDYVAVIKGECEATVKAKDAEMEVKLKHLVRDLCAEIDVKNRDYDEIIGDLIEKSRGQEEKLQNEHRMEMAALNQALFEKEFALEEMRDYYQEALHDKDEKLKEQETIIKSLSQKPSESFQMAPESSDWDDTWAVPDEVENSSPIHNEKACDDHVQQIESLQEELSKCNSEIKELKILLRLSPPDSMVNNNNRRDSLQLVPEPTEFEYLKNIIYEYMMGKEPLTLAKVIAAVLRFNDVQTQQVIRREEARHPTK